MYSANIIKILILIDFIWYDINIIIFEIKFRAFSIQVVYHKSKVLLYLCYQIIN